MIFRPFIHGCRKKSYDIPALPALIQSHSRARSLVPSSVVGSKIRSNTPYLYIIYTALARINTLQCHETKLWTPKPTAWPQWPVQQIVVRGLSLLFRNMRLSDLHPASRPMIQLAHTCKRGKCAWFPHFSLQPNVCGPAQNTKA